MTWYELFNLLIDEIYNRELLMNRYSDKYIKYKNFGIRN